MPNRKKWNPSWAQQSQTCYCWYNRKAFDCSRELDHLQRRKIKGKWCHHWGMSCISSTIWETENLTKIYCSSEVCHIIGRFQWLEGADWCVREETLGYWTGQKQYLRRDVEEGHWNPALAALKDSITQGKTSRVPHWKVWVLKSRSCYYPNNHDNIPSNRWPIWPIQ